MARNVTKRAVQPSRIMGFTPSVPVERSLYKQELHDDPDFWGSEYGFLGDSAADAAATPPAKTWYENLIDIYGAYKAQDIALKNQDMLAKENAARVSRGQQAVDMSTYMQRTAPQVNVGLSPMVTNILIYGGLGLAAILLIPRLLPKRR